MLRKILISLFFVSAIGIGSAYLAKTSSEEPIVEQQALPAIVTPPSPPVMEAALDPKTTVQKTATPAVVAPTVQEEIPTTEPAPAPEPKRTIRTSTSTQKTGAKSSADTTVTPVGNDSIFSGMDYI